MCQNNNRHRESAKNKENCADQWPTHGSSKGKENVLTIINITNLPKVKRIGVLNAQPLGLPKLRRMCIHNNRPWRSYRRVENGGDKSTSLAWSKKIVGAIPRHFKSLIQPYMARKCSFRGFRIQFWTFPMADPEAHIRHFLGPLAQTCGFWNSQYFSFEHFLVFSLARKCLLWGGSRNSF